MNYVEFDFFTKDEIERGWLISILSDCGFEGFEETTEWLKGFVPEDKLGAISIPQILKDNEFGHITFNRLQIEQKNWNEEWEKNFEPVIIAGNIGIRAPFHQPLNTPFELVIEPKMSFGTGHHATTALMAQLMLQINLAGKTVLDFGSGTGVLAILAEKLKASKIVAIDNEKWAFENCIENAQRNGCVKITCLHGDDTYVFNEKFDVILANINRHVILKNLGAWSVLLNAGGLMLVSGILLSDESDIIAAAANCGLSVQTVLKENGWLAIAFNAG